MMDMTPPATALDALIDEYLAHEARYVPRLWFPSRAAGTEGARPSRQWQSEQETLADEETSAAMRAMEGAWDSLTVSQDRALRADARNRAAGIAVWRVPGVGAYETRALITQAKERLARLLADRGIVT